MGRNATAQPSGCVCFGEAPVEDLQVHDDFVERTANPPAAANKRSGDNQNHRRDVAQSLRMPRMDNLNRGHNWRPARVRIAIGSSVSRASDRR